MSAGMARPRGAIGFTLVGALVLGSVVFGAAAAQLPGPLSVHTAEQAGRGRTAYESACASCHGGMLQGVGEAPPLSGMTFLTGWRNRPILELVEYIATRMPPVAPGSLGAQTHVDLVAYLLQENGARPGADTLGTASAVSIDAVLARQVAAVPSRTPRAQSSEDERLLRRHTVTGEVARYSAVTDQMLRAPAADDWLMFRRDFQSSGYSPLAEITRENVADLKLAWAWMMNEGGRNQPTPIVHDGTVFLANIGHIVQAFDGRSGELIWEQQIGGAPIAAQSATRSVALYDNLVIVALHDARIVALDARSGGIVWETTAADHSLGRMITSGPIVVNGNVIHGQSGCQRFTEQGCFIGALDAGTGRPVWKFWTTARADQPGGNTWGNLLDHQRAGGDPWMTGSYDPGLNLLYWGTAQAKPFLAASRGLTTADAALYTNSTVALRPDDGSLVWHYQHVPGESLDLDEAFERLLVDADGRKLLFTIGKHGILWKLDRETGAFVGHSETVYQDIFKDIDGETGRVTYRDDIANAKIGDTLSVCPATSGGHTRDAMAYHPGAGLLIIPLNQACMEFAGRPVEFGLNQGGHGGAVSRLFEMPGTDGKLGLLSAYDVRTMEEVWSIEQRAQFTSSTLTTAGDLVFIGDQDRYVRALDVRTGEVLWRTRLATSPQGSLVSFGVDGEQFLAVPTGVGGGSARRIGRAVATDIHHPTTGSAIYVFSLQGLSRR